MNLIYDICFIFSTIYDFNFIVPVKPVWSTIIAVYESFVRFIHEKQRCAGVPRSFINIGEFLVHKILVVGTQYFRSERVTWLILKEFVFLNQSQWDLPHVNSASFLSYFVALEDILDNLWSIPETFIRIVIYLVYEYLWLFYAWTCKLWDCHLLHNIDKLTLEGNCSTIWWMNDCSVVFKCIAFS